MLLESACIPIPSEVTMLFAGALVSAPFLAPDQQLNFVTVVLVGTAGNLVGSWLAYGVGYKGGRPLVDRWSRYLLLRPHEIDRAHSWFDDKYGHRAVFFGRLLPVIRTFISLPAGVARMNFGKFTLYTLLGCLPWCLALTWLGYVLGENWAAVEKVLRPIAWLIALAVVVVVVWFVWHRIRMFRAERATAEAAAAAAAAAEGAPGEEPEPAER
jgi:membrane protein DedA with SNARE-associated domain